MTATVLASITAGGTTAAALSVPNLHVCQVPGALNFATARSFVEPTADNKAALANLVTRLGLGGTLNQLLINGHTDLVGAAVANQRLSERRTRAVDGVLR